MNIKFKSNKYLPMELVINNATKIEREIAFFILKNLVVTARD